jgi:glycosyltransferase involved in cell wall biosynthesis
MTTQNILIDARALQEGFKAHKHRGIGYYAQRLITELITSEVADDLTFLQEKRLPTDELILEKHLLYHSSFLHLPQALNLIETQRTLSRVISTQKFSLVHYLSHFDASFLTRCPYIVSVMDTITLSAKELYSFPQQIKYNILHKYVKRVVHRAAMVIAISEQTKKDIMKYYGIPSNKICVVPLAVEERYSHHWHPSDVVNFRSKYGLPDTFVLYVGGIDPRKNIEIIFKAMKALVATGQTCPFLAFAGRVADQCEYPNMMKIIRSLGIEHLIKFLGYVPDDDLPLLYHASVAFIYPSRYEGFGLPVLQAMAAGTPVITTKLSSIPEVAGSAALYIDPDDPATLIQALQALQTNNNLRSSLISSGKQQAGKFSWRRTANETINVYREVMNVQKKSEQ